MHRWLPLGLILILLIAFRVLGSAFPETFPNFQPIAALFFCGAFLATGWRGFVIAFTAWVVTYPVPALFQGFNLLGSPAVFLTTLAAFTVVFVMGKFLTQRSLPVALFGSVGAAVVFHLITNGAAWLGDPRYAKTLTGLTQSLWTGLPGDPLPSWVFLRNLVAANFLFTAVFLSARIFLPKPVEYSKLHPAR
jgi:hypothetical protein